MKVGEVNSILRQKIKQAIETGWTKTQIGLLLLGSNGQAHLNNFLKSDESGKTNDFGVKPLQKIANLIDYEARIIFVKKGNQPAVEYVDQMDLIFFDELFESVKNYLQNNKHPSPISKTSKTQVDKILDEMLEEEEQTTS